MPYEPIKCVDMTGFKRIIRERFSLVNYTKFLAFARTADTLYADHMNLTRFPVSLVRALPNLELIDLQGNNIKRLPIRMHLVAPKLDKLLVADNRVAIPKSKPLIISATIRTLMLSNNGIEHIFKHTFTKLPALEVLYLDGNKLRNIAPIVGVLPSLKYLHVGRNYLQEIPPQDVKYYVTKDQRIPEF
nr:unnamed protein product [Callosobruchus chinensis]